VYPTFIRLGVFVSDSPPSKTIMIFLDSTWPPLYEWEGSLLWTTIKQSATVIVIELTLFCFFLVAYLLCYCFGCFFSFVDFCLASELFQAPHSSLGSEHMDAAKLGFRGYSQVVRIGISNMNDTFQSLQLAPLLT
jgi:hypothetical protein